MLKKFIFVSIDVNSIRTYSKTYYERVQKFCWKHKVIVKSLELINLYLRYQRWKYQVTLPLIDVSIIYLKYIILYLSLHNFIENRDNSTYLLMWNIPAVTIIFYYLFYLHDELRTWLPNFNWNKITAQN